MEEEIDLREIFDIFWCKKLWIIIAGVLGIILGAVFTDWFIVPEYGSSVTLVLTKSTEGNNITTEGITQSDVTLNQKLISTYREIIKSKDLLNRVIADLNLDMSYDELFKMIKVESVTNTDIMKVTVTTENADLSANIVNQLTKVFEDELMIIYGIKNTYILGDGEVEEEPVNVNLIKNVVIFAMVAVILVMMVIFMMYFFDTSIKNKADAERFLGIPVLAVIPLSDEGEVKKDEKKRK